MDPGWHVDGSGSGDGSVEFVIGMRWSALWRLPARPWVVRSFLAMCSTDPSAGLESSRLALRAGGPVVVQRWRSRSDLDAWARAPHHVHAPAWARFRRIAAGTASWGIWHELRPVSV